MKCSQPNCKRVQNDGGTSLIDIGNGYFCSDHLNPPPPVVDSDENKAARAADLAAKK